ncbi:hypothetical protein ABNN70_05705 [Sporolactobacillus sp. Y61]|uniref:Uncharacterized protein n=1 Tax=Sporolactobacillus sp. Y61 TaxID=3160863 RepID=A0AAU8IIA4_9BACL
MKLRWKGIHFSQRAKFLGDEWGRGYETMGFHGMIENRLMPWYFIVSGKGKKIWVWSQDAAVGMCFWKFDSAGFTLFLDVRNG